MYKRAWTHVLNTKLYTSLIKQQTSWYVSRFLVANFVKTIDSYICLSIQSHAKTYRPAHVVLTRTYHTCLNSPFKHASTATSYLGGLDTYNCNRDPLSASLIDVKEQQPLWRDWAGAESRPNCCSSAMTYTKI